MSFSAKRSPYSGMPSFSSQSPISCTAAHPLTHLAGEHIQSRGCRPFRPRRSATGNGRAGSPRVSLSAAISRGGRPSLVLC